MNQPLLLTIAGIALLVAGAAIGYVFARSRGDRDSVQRATRIQEEYDAYRAQVTEHFRETAGQFQALGEQYRDLYRHLAGGAEALCDTGDEAGRLEFRPPPELVHDAGEGAGEGPGADKRPDEVAAGTGQGRAAPDVGGEAPGSEEGPDSPRQTGSEPGQAVSEKKSGSQGSAAAAEGPTENGEGDGPSPEATGEKKPAGSGAGSASA